MDTRLEKALSFANYRATIENRKKALVRRYNAMISVHYESGMFNAEPETMSFIWSLISNGHASAIVLDIKQNPIEIVNLKEFYENLSDAYFKATNEYSSEMAKLSKARSVKKAMEW